MLDLQKQHAAELNPHKKSMLQHQIDATDRQANSRSPTGWSLTCTG